MLKVMVHPLPPHAVALLAAGLLGLFAAAGALLLYRGLRGRRTDDHPLCRRCGFDLTGLPGGHPACPECGATLAAPQAVRVGHRARRPAPLAAGLALLLLTVGLAGGAGWAALRGVD